MAGEDGSRNLKISYTNGLNEVISRTEHDGETADTIFFLYDANCNVNAIVDEAGELVKTFDYEEFGGPHPAGVGETYLTNGNAENNKLLFAGGVGHLTDDSGLIYMRARYYDPASGRFVSEDPARNGSNWYAYCGNNPVNFIDGSGQFAIPAIVAAMIIGAVVGLGIYLGFQAVTGGEITGKGALEALGLGALGVLVVFALGVLAGAAGMAGLATLASGSMTATELTLGVILGFMGGEMSGMAFGGLDQAWEAIATNWLSTAMAMDIVDYGDSDVYGE